MSTQQSRIPNFLMFVAPQTSDASLSSLSHRLLHPSNMWVLLAQPLAFHWATRILHKTTAQIQNGHVLLHSEVIYRPDPSSRFSRTATFWWTCRRIVLSCVDGASDNASVSQATGENSLRSERQGDDSNCHGLCSWSFNKQCRDGKCGKHVKYAAQWTQSRLQPMFELEMLIPCAPSATS